jgi:thiaminase/transcriptional activator TenA
VLGQSIGGTLAARDRLRGSWTTLARELGLPAEEHRPTITPTITSATSAHTSFFTSATAGSFHSGLGALLPMVWFNAEVSDKLINEVRPGSRYQSWIEAYHPGDSYRYAVEAFLEMADRSVEQASARQRRSIIEQFSISVDYELAFAENCSPGLSATP